MKKTNLLIKAKVIIASLAILGAFQSQAQTNSNEGTEKTIQVQEVIPLENGYAVVVKNAESILTLDNASTFSEEQMETLLNSAGTDKAINVKIKAQKIVDIQK